MSENLKACSFCGGSGYRYVLPEGRNPFHMRIEQIAASSRRVKCFHTAALRSPSTEEQ